MQIELKYIKDNTHKGFDELAFDLDLPKEKVKKMWNDLGLGWHMTPNTFVELKYIGESNYVVLKDVPIFIAPFTLMVIPKGLTTDFASIPRFARWFISPDATWITIPALLHDVLYAAEWVDRPVADAIFKQVMKYRRASWIKYNLVYLAVRAGGWYTWWTHNTEEVKSYKELLQKTVLQYIEEKDVIKNSKSIL